MKSKRTLKKLIICMLCVICTLITFTPVNANAATKVTLSNTKITLKLGNTKVLKLKNAKGKVTWKTSNAKVVSIKKKDATSITLTPKKQGNVTIVATNNKKTYTCKVHVPKAKHIKWEDETVFLGRVNTIPIENVNTPIQWSIDDNKVASIKASGKNKTKLEITSLTHGETMIHAAIDGIVYDMKVIVPEVKLDVAKITNDSSKYYVAHNILGISRYNINTYYDKNGNDITDTFDITYGYNDNGNLNYNNRGPLVERFRNYYLTNFVGTDIDFGDCKWISSNPKKVTLTGTNWLHFYECGKGSVTFTTKLGNETFSFVVEYDICEWPQDDI